MQREKFSSRLGFLLISAGCAIGLGNVWRFPYVTGEYGGAAFVLLYLFFLLALAGAAAACCCTQRAARCRYFVISEEPSKINFAETLAAIQAKYPR